MVKGERERENINGEEKGGREREALLDNYINNGFINTNWNMMNNIIPA